MNSLRCQSCADLKKQMQGIAGFAFGACGVTAVLSAKASYNQGVACWLSWRGGTYVGTFVHGSLFAVAATITYFSLSFLEMFRRDVGIDPQSNDLASTLSLLDRWGGNPVSFRPNVSEESCTPSSKRVENSIK